MSKTTPPNDTPQMEPLLDSMAASRYLGISRITLDKWVRDKRLPFTRVGKLIRFRPEALRDWVKAHENTPLDPAPTNTEVKPI